jgi:hypothetical protein
MYLTIKAIYGTNKGPVEKYKWVFITFVRKGFGSTLLLLVM